MTPAVQHTITSLLPPAGAAVVRYHAQCIGSHARAPRCIRPHFHAEREQSDVRVWPTDTGTAGDHHDERDGDGGRMEKTAELYKAGYADHVLITPVVETEELSQSTALAVEYGIPEEALIKDYEADSTYTNAAVTMDIMEEHGFDSALVVTSDYHVKRSKYIF